LAKMIPPSVQNSILPRFQEFTCDIANSFYVIGMLFTCTVFQ